MPCSCICPVTILTLPILGEKECPDRADIIEPARLESLWVSRFGRADVEFRHCRSEEPVAPFVQLAEFAGHLRDNLLCSLPMRSMLADFLLQPLALNLFTLG